MPWGLASAPWSITSRCSGWSTSVSKHGGPGGGGGGNSEVRCSTLGGWGRGKDNYEAMCWGLEMIVK